MGPLVLTGSFHLSVTNRDETIRASTSLGADGNRDPSDPSVIKVSGWSGVCLSTGAEGATASRVPESAEGAVVKSVGTDDVPLS